MILDFKHIKFRNIFSFGNNWQEYSFDNNINLIVSGDKTRANFVGKTSMIKPISFVLFGKVKDVVKSDIINWQNQKKCQVNILLEKNGDKIVIKRGLKPAFLKIWINDIPQPVDSDVRIAQKNLENDIIGINYETFNNLFFCNSNNTISILDAPAIKKRKFVENLFTDMVYFSDLMESTNEKLKSINDKIKEKEIKKTFINDHISTLEKELSVLTVPDIQTSFSNFKKYEDEYETIIKNTDISEEDIKFNKTLLDKTNHILNKYETAEKWITNENFKIGVKLDNLKEDLEKSKKREEYVKKLQEINTFLESTPQPSDLTDVLEEINENINESNIKVSDINNKILNLKEERKKTKPDYNLKNKTICPTCKGKIDYDKIKDHYNEEREKIDVKINNEKTLLKKESKKLEKLKNEQADLKKESNENKQTITKIYQFIEKKKIYENFLNESISLLDLKKIENSCNRKVKAFEVGLKNLKRMTSQILLLIDEYTFKLNSIKNNKEKIVEIKLKYENVKNIYDNDKLRLQDIKKRRLNKEIKIDDYKKEMAEIDTSIIKLNDLKDHLLVLKTSLKDENIKSHVINIIIPYLNQNVNEYLSELGFDFFVEFDSWLNIKISGPGGRYECRLGSMSGAESKAIDLCTKFALMDVTRMKSEIYPNILLFDEILDSSIDDFGIEMLMKIIKRKQEIDKIKIFIISHKKEIGEFSYDKIFKVYKRNNFSYIE